MVRSLSLLHAGTVGRFGLRRPPRHATRVPTSGRVPGLAYLQGRTRHVAPNLPEALDGGPVAPPPAEGTRVRHHVRGRLRDHRADLLLLPGVAAGLVTMSQVLTGPSRAVAAIVLVTAGDAIVNRHRGLRR